MPEKTLKEKLLETYPNATVRKMEPIKPAKAEPYEPKGKGPSSKLEVGFEPIGLSESKGERIPFDGGAIIRGFAFQTLQEAIRFVSKHKLKDWEITKCKDGYRVV